VLSLAEGLLKEDPADLLARGVVIEALHELKRHEEAAERTKGWLEDEVAADRIFWHRFRLLDTYEKAERYAAAQGLLDEWIEADAEQRVRLRANKVRLYLAAGQEDRAVEYVKQWLAGKPNDEDVRASVADVMLEAEANEPLIPLLREWVKDATGEAAERYRAALVMALASTNRVDDARQYVEAWIKKSKPYDLTPRRVLIGALVMAEEYEAAEKQAAEWLEQYRAASGTTKPAGYQEALRWARQTLVSALLLQRKHKEALKRVEVFLADDPEQMSLYNLKSTALSELGRRKDALAAVEKAYELDPEDPSNNNNLGYYYADVGIHLDRAEAMLNKALSKAPGQVAFQDSLAWVYYKQGRIRRAGAIFDELAGRTGDVEIEHPVIHDHAGDAYWRLGWTRKAKKAWETALRLAREGDDTDSREVREVRKAVERKLEALREGRAVPVAPLGEGVTEHDGEQ
jgi:tetratricopeptide (TPR) repeat protein